MPVVALPAEATKNRQGVRFNWGQGVAKARRVTVGMLDHQKKKSNHLPARQRLLGFGLVAKVLHQGFCPWPSIFL
jgi:hypothetical protein